MSVNDVISKEIESRFIILNNSTTKDGFISNIDKIIIENEYIFILDCISSKVLKFAIDGNFEMTYGQKGRGHGEFVEVSDFVIFDNNIFILDANTKRLLSYDLSSGIFINSVDIPFDVEVFAKISDESWMWGLAPYNSQKHSGDKLIITDNSFNQTATILKYDKELVDDNYRFPSSIIKLEDGKYIYNRPIENNIYIVDKLGCVNESINIDFGKYSVPPKYYTKVDELMNDASTVVKFIVNTPIVFNDYIFGNIFSNTNQFESFSFNRDTQESFVSDINSFCLPTIFNAIAVSSHNEIICYINSQIHPNFSDDPILPDSIKLRIQEGEFVILVHSITDKELIC